MTTTVLKKEIVKAINDINDESFLQAVYTILNTHNNGYEYELTDEDKNILNERKAHYKSGKAKTYTVAEVRKKVLKSLSK
jgi:hypothetical protein